MNTFGCGDFFTHAVSVDEGLIKLVAAKSQSSKVHMRQAAMDLDHGHFFSKRTSRCNYCGLSYSDYIFKYKHRSFETMVFCKDMINTFKADAYLGLHSYFRK